MESSKDDDGLLTRVVFSGAVPLANGRGPPHGMPLREPFRVPFPFERRYWEQAYGGHVPRVPCVPFPGYMGFYDCSFEPAFIRKRNERERQRVRCVNEGYARLREHLPQELAGRRLSKVETLRAAIGYIKHLQSLLGCQPPTAGSAAAGPASPAPPGECNSDGESKSSSASSPCSEFEEPGS